MLARVSACAIHLVFWFWKAFNKVKFVYFRETCVICVKIPFHLDFFVLLCVLDLFVFVDHEKRKLAGLSHFPKVRFFHKKEVWLQVQRNFRSGCFSFYWKIFAKFACSYLNFCVFDGIYDFLWPLWRVTWLLFGKNSFLYYFK